MKCVSCGIEKRVVLNSLTIVVHHSINIVARETFCFQGCSFKARTECENKLLFTKSPLINQDVNKHGKLGMIKDYVTVCRFKFNPVIQFNYSEHVTTEVP